MKDKKILPPKWGSGSSNDGDNTNKAAKGKRPLSLTTIVLFVLAIGIASTIAYLTFNAEKKVNAFGIRNEEVVIVEPSVDPDNVEWGTDTKPVQLMNPDDPDNGAGIVRVMIIPVVYDADGNAVIASLGSLAAPNASGQLVLGDFIFHFNSGWETDWFYEDGYFYYRKVLNPGESTSKILQGVTLNTGAGVTMADYEDYTVEIEVMAEIIQPEGDGPSLWGVSVNSSGVVSP